jgi:tRNA-splicing ligase RtcB (3'-phosphate/5'-hydroxy nucleic acid ligase)
MKENLTRDDLIKIDETCYEIPKSFRSDMRVPARVFVNENLLEEIFKDRSLVQIVNVATLPGIVNYAIAMPDIHEGYGFPIGGVAATAISQGGVISPGGIGYDINCGVRLLAADINAQEIRPFFALSETRSGSAFFIQPCSSQNSLSDAFPKPRSSI